MPKLYVITGPSGVGKTTVAMKLIEQIPHLKKLVTCTTRPKREGEKQDVDYHFLTEDLFKQMRERGELFEWDEHYGAFYGNRTAELEELFAAGFDVLMVVDVHGARTIKLNRPDAFVLFLTVDSLSALEERIRSRGHVSDEELAKRMDRVREEMNFASEAHLVVSNPEGKLDETVAELRSILTGAA